MPGDTAGSQGTSEHTADELRLMQRGQELLQARLRDPNAPHYTPEQAAIMQQRGRAIFEAHQQAKREASAAQEPHRGTTAPAQATSTAADQHTHSAIVPDNKAASLAERMVPQSEVDAMRAKLIEQFNAHIASCENKNRAYWEQVTAQQSAIVTGLEQERDTWRQSYERLQAEHTSADKETLGEVSKLRQELAAAQDKLQALETQRDALAKENARLAQALAEHERELQAVMQSLQTKEEELEAANYQESELHQALQDLQAQLEHKTNELLQLSQERQAEQERYTAQRNEAEEHMRTLASHNAELEEKLSAAEAALEDATASHAVLAEDGDKLNELLTKEREASARLASEVHDLRAQLHELQTTAASTSAVESTALIQPGTQAAPVHDPSNPFADESDEVFAGPAGQGVPPAVGLSAEAEARLNAANGRIAELEEKLSAAEAALEDATASHAVLAEDGDKLNELLTKEREASARLASEVHDLRAQLHELQTTAASTSAVESTALIQPGTQAAPVHDPSNPFADESDEVFAGPAEQGVPPAVGLSAEAEARLNAANGRIAELEEKLSAAEAALEDATASHAVLAEDGDKLNELLTKEREVSARLASEVHDLRAQLHELQTAIASQSHAASHHGSTTVSPPLRPSMTALDEAVTAEAKLTSNSPSRTPMQDSSLKERVDEVVSLAGSHIQRQQDASLPGLEELGRKYAAAEHRYQEAEEARAALEAKVEELMRELQLVSTLGSPDGEAHVTSSEQDAVQDSTSTTRPTSRALLSASNGGSAAVMQSAGRATTMTEQAHAGTANPFANASESAGSTTCDVFAADINDVAASNVPVSVHSSPAAQEAGLEMQNWGRRFAEEQHRREEAEEELRQTQAELRAAQAELAAMQRVLQGIAQADEDTEESAQKQQQRFNVDGGSSSSDEVVTALQARIAALEQELHELAEQHEQELQDLADEAADRLAETEDYYEQQLAERLEQHPPNDGNTQPTTSTAVEVKELEAQLTSLRQTIATLEEERERTARSHAREIDSVVEAYENSLRQHDELLRRRLDEEKARYETLMQEQQQQRASSVPQQTQTEDTKEHVMSHEVATNTTQGSSAVADMAVQTAVPTTTQPVIATQSSELEQQGTVSADQLQQTTAELAELQRAYDALQHEKAEHEATATQVQADLQRLRAEYASLQERHDELAELLQVGANSVQNALQEQQQQNARLNDRVRQLQQTVQQRESELQAAHADYATLRAEMESQVEAARVGAATELHKLRDSHEQQLTQVRAEKAERALREQERLMHEYAEERTRLQQVHERESDALRQELQQLRDELHSVQSLAASRPLELQSQQHQLDELRRQLREAQERNELLNNSLRASRQPATMPATNATHNDNNTSEAMDAQVNSLLERNDSLERRLRELQGDKAQLTSEKDALAVELLRLTRAVELKTQTVQRQDAELQHSRSQLIGLKEDLTSRVHQVQLLRTELDEVREHATELATAYEEVQETAVELRDDALMQEQSGRLLFAKAETLPQLMQDYCGALLMGYNGFVAAMQDYQRRVVERCDAIEQTALGAMQDAALQHQSYEEALREAREEQAELHSLVAQLERKAQSAEEAAATAASELTIAQDTIAALQRQAQERAFATQRELQASELVQADRMHSVSLLQAELQEAAVRLERQQAAAEQRHATLQAELNKVNAALVEAEAAHIAFKEDIAAEQARLRERTEAAEVAREESERALHIAQAQLSRALPRLAQLEQEHAQRSAELMDTAQQLTAMTQKSSSTEAVARSRLEQLHHTLQELMQAHGELQRRSTTQEATIDQLQAQVAELTLQLERSEARATQSGAEVESLTTRLHQSETQYAKERAALETQSRDAGLRCASLEQRCAGLQESLTVLQQRLAEVQAGYDRTSRTLLEATEQAQSTEQQQRRQIESLQTQLNTLEAQRTTLQQEHDHSTTAEQTLRQSLTEAETELRASRAHLDTANKHNEHLNMEMQRSTAAHETELIALKETLARAQQETTEARHALATAESKLLEQESTLYRVSKEAETLRVELRNTRATLSESDEKAQKLACELQSVCAARDSAQHQWSRDQQAQQAELQRLTLVLNQREAQLTSLQVDLAEKEKHMQQRDAEAAAMRAELASTREQHRRERQGLQASLDTTEARLQELTRSHAAYEQSMTKKLEMYAVIEDSLRREGAALQDDVSRLQAALSAATRERQSVESHTTRQRESLQQYEAELQSLRERAAQDARTIHDLTLALQQRSTELERQAQSAATALATQAAQLTSERELACAALQAALEREKGCTAEARTARERALAALDRIQREMDALAAQSATLHAQLHELQHDYTTQRHRCAAVQSAAAAAAAELGITPTTITNTTRDISKDIEGDDEDDEDDAMEKVQEVLRVVMDRLRAFGYAAHSLDVEEAQLAELRRALGQHQDIMRHLMQGSNSNTSHPVKMITANCALASEALDSRPASTPAGLASRHRVKHDKAAAKEEGDSNDDDVEQERLSEYGMDTRGEESITSSLSRLHLYSPTQRQLLQFLRQSSVTFVHRVEDHMHTMQQLMRTIALTLATAEAPTVQPRSGTMKRETSSPQTLPAAALVARQRLLITSVTSELHRRTMALTRALMQIMRHAEQLASVCHGEHTTGASHSTNNSTTGLRAGSATASSSLFGPTQERMQEEARSRLTASLQAAMKRFTEAERYVLRPFNELLGSDANGAVDNDDRAEGEVVVGATPAAVRVSVPNTPSVHSTPASSLARPRSRAV